MPRPATPASKKQQLTLAQLSSYDDILTDALVDNTYYWTTVPKNRPSYHPSRGIREEEIAKLIQTHLIVDPNVAVAEERLMAVDGLKRFCNQLKTPKEKEDFKAHMRRYMSIYLPDCPWEVDSTNRYTIVTQEAKVTARRPIKRNETIKYLAGIQVVVTPQEEAEMALRKKDFSLIVSSRSKSTSLFMGPARFANHDCNANARLITKGQAAIEVIACRHIELGEEITVSYSEHYFGENNCECLCKSCEDNMVNGWAPTNGAIPVKKSIEEDSQGGLAYSLRRRRRQSSADFSRTPSATPDVRPRILRGKKSQKNLARELESSTLVSPAVQDLADGTNLKRKGGLGDDLLATPPITPMTKKQKTSHYQLSPLPVTFPQSPASLDSDVGHSPLSAVSSAEAVMTDATTPEAESPEPQILSPKPIRVDQEIRVLKQEDDVDEVDVIQVPVAKTQSQDERKSPSIRPTIETVSESEQVSVGAPAPQPLEGSQEPSAESQPVEFQVTDSMNDAGAATQSIESARREPSRFDTIEVVEVTPKQKRPAKGTGALATPKSEKSRIPEPPQPSRSRERVPGDYTLTPLLLATADSAWIRCMNCDNAFVQPDAYYTRVNCPRCERHSKLYGYAWPKTQRAGPSDKEERVLDHRTVHRFLDRQDEARVRGRVYTKYEPKPAAQRLLKKAVAAAAVVVVEQPRYAQGKSELSAGVDRQLNEEKTRRDEIEASSGLRRSGRVRKTSLRASYAEE